ncbi:hypothetical protein FNV43_RR17809 [Rhamnella rubrinervis]|uniref:Uncharacterized protein n=1 Tax=Rhamnella rubrinervis TaxID=2594499 RepID=A0A8K0E3B7_9ROSA|nr:hypothetical protein FNV43_RR17809 [Rhamnella rubrinervis]
MWGRPQAPKPESEASDEARQQAAVAHSGLLPRAVISQQQSQFQPGGPHDQGTSMHYYNIPPPSQQERAYYPSMDPQRMGALVPNQEAAPNGPSGSGENKSGPEKPQHGQHFAYQGMPLPHGQYQHQYYPPYGYVRPPPPYQQYPQYNSAMPPLPSQPPPMNQQFQHSATPGSASSVSTSSSGSAAASSSQQ